MNEFRCVPMRILVVVGLAVGVNGGLVTDATAGPYAAVGIAGWVDAPGGESMLNPELRTWASGVVDYRPTLGVADPNDDPTSALGPITSTTFG